MTCTLPSQKYNTETYLTTSQHLEKNKMASTPRLHSQAVEPPLPPSPRHTRGKALSPYIIGWIIGMCNAGFSFGKIAKELDLNKTTVFLACRCAK